MASTPAMRGASDAAAASPFQTRAERVPPRPGDRGRQREAHRDRPEPPPREERQARDFLRHLHLEGIDGTERGTDRGGADADRDAGVCVEPEPARHQHQHRNERDDLLRHVLERAGGGERERDGNHQRVPVRRGVGAG
jgi:hypothetical protein